MNNIHVFEFGDSSLANKNDIIQLGNIISNQHSESILVVISTIGEQKARFEELVNAYFYQKGNPSEILASIKLYYATLSDDLLENALPLRDQLNDYFIEIEWILEDVIQDSYAYIFDQVISIGSLLSSTIIYAYLTNIGCKSKWVDARNMIQTDDSYMDGEVDWTITTKKVVHRIAPLFNNERVIVTQGGIASTYDNQTTTLSPHGSIQSASIFSNCLGAKEMTIWNANKTELNAVPNVKSAVDTIEKQSYDDALKLSYLDTRILSPLKEKAIPIYIKSMINPSLGIIKISE